MKVSTILLGAFFIAATLLSTRVAIAQASSGQEEWQQLGTHVVDYTLDYDVDRKSVV